VGSFQSLRRVVRRHYDYNFFAVQHTVTSRPKISIPYLVRNVFS
jgi:hypothetical protein